MAIHVGCGSWADPEYTGVLYPPGLSAKKRLSVYATHFDHVEVNSSYYATPRSSVVAGWAKETPPGFSFDIKLHRAFSRNPQKVARESDLLKFLKKGIEPLVRSKKMGAFLLVLAPDFSPERHSLDELNDLIEQLRPYTVAVELRHNSWVKGKRRAETFKFYRERKIAWVSVDMPQIADSQLMPPLDEVTVPHLAYLRLHGRNPQYLEAKSAAEGHHYEYNAKELTSLVKRIQQLASEARDVHVVANNHAEDFAPRTALALKERLGRGSSA